MVNPFEQPPKIETPPEEEKKVEQPEKDDKEIKKEEIIEKAKTRERAEYKEGRCSACGVEVRSGNFCEECGATFLKNEKVQTQERIFVKKSKELSEKQRDNFDKFLEGLIDADYEDWMRGIERLKKFRKDCDEWGDKKIAEFFSGALKEKQEKRAKEIDKELKNERLKGELERKEDLKRLKLEAREDQKRWRLEQKEADELSSKQKHERRKRLIEELEKWKAL